MEHFKACYKSHKGYEYYGDPADAMEDRWRDEPTEPSAEWDVENFAAATSNLRNGATGDGWDSGLEPDLENRRYAFTYLPYGNATVVM